MEKTKTRLEAELLHERLIRVENSLFFLRMKSKCFDFWDNSEIERLEELRADLRARCEGIARNPAWWLPRLTYPRVVTSRGAILPPPIMPGPPIAP